MDDEYKNTIDIVGDLGHSVMIMETAFNADINVFPHKAG